MSIRNIINKVDDPINAAKSAVSSEFPQVAKEIDDVVAAVESGLSVEEIVAKFGKACGLPGSFQGSLASILISPDYVSAVRRNILAGGDCCSRATIRFIVLWSNPSMLLSLPRSGIGYIGACRC